MNRKEMNMTEGALLPKIIRFAIPLALTGILQTLYHAADLVVVGRFTGHIALAAVGSTGSLYNLLVNLFMGLSVGAGVCVAQYVGAKNDDGVRKTLRTSFLLALILGVSVAIMGLALARPILIAMDTPPDVLEPALLYLRILFLGLPASMLYNFLASVLRSTGDSKRPLLYLSVSGLVNVGLNLLLVLVFDMGVAGVAIGTIASNALSAILILIHLYGRNDYLRFRLSGLRIYRKELWKMMCVGIPAGVQSALFSLSNVLIQSAINGFGDIVMAGNSTAANVENFLYVSGNAIALAGTTFVGQNVGAKRYDRIKRVVLCCSGLVILVGLSMASLLYAIHTPLFALYSGGNVAVEEAAIPRLVILGFTYFLCGIMEVASGALRGMSKSFIAMIVSLLGACGFRILWLYTVFPMFPTSTCIYISYPVTWFLTAITHLIILGIFVRRLKQTMPLE